MMSGHRVRGKVAAAFFAEMELNTLLSQLNKQNRKSMDYGFV